MSTPKEVSRKLRVLEVIAHEKTEQAIAFNSLLEEGCGLCVKGRPKGLLWRRGYPSCIYANAIPPPYFRLAVGGQRAKQCRSKGLRRVSQLALHLRQSLLQPSFRPAGGSASAAKPVRGLLRRVSQPALHPNHASPPAPLSQNHTSN
jgi:hypothetical protein